MTVSASRTDHHVDVLDSGEGMPARGRPSRSAVVAGAAVVLAVALAVPVVGDANWGAEAAAGPVSLEGTLRLADRSDPGGGRGGWGDGQERDAQSSGTVLLELPDRQLRGAAQIDVEASSRGDGADGWHSWGDLRLLVGSPAVACRGSFGWSRLQDRPEGGGAMHARCDDGAVLAATMVTTQEVPGDRGLVVDLRDGWYVAGAASDEAPEPRPGTLPQPAR